MGINFLKREVAVLDELIEESCDVNGPRLDTELPPDMGISLTLHLLCLFLSSIPIQSRPRLTSYRTG